MEAVRTTGQRLTWTALFVLALDVVPTPAWAFEVSGGVSLGGFQVGTLPRLAVTPHVGLSWLRESGFLFVVHDLFSILAPINKTGLGIYNKTSVTIGYASEKVNVSAGPSFSIYSMSVCNVTLLCGPVVGVGLGGHAQADVYFTGPLGVSVSGNVDLIGGRSRVLPSSVAMMLVAGPVLRWMAK